MYDIVAYVLYAGDCLHIPLTAHYFDKERTNTMKIHFAYCNQYKNGIDIAFDETVRNLHTTPNSQRLIDTFLINHKILQNAINHHLSNIILILLFSCPHNQEIYLSIHHFYIFLVF